jgi:hypothetical protein
MSQEFNRPIQEQTTPSQPAPQPKRSNTWIYIAIIVLLLISNIYLYINRNTVIEQRDVAETQYASSDSSRRAVEADYSAALVRLDELVSKNNQMDSIISNQDGEIAKLKKQINAIVKDKNASAADLGKAKKLIARLNTRVKTYEERIAELESQNVTLTTANIQLATNLDSTSAENVGLTEKVKLGAVLHASNIRMTPIDVRRGGKKEVETGRASRVDMLRILFDIDENRIAESGKKEIFLRITGPAGNVLSNAAYGSGVTTTSDGQSLNYTLLKQIDLEQNQPVKNVIVDWKQESDYARGSYTIELYHEGFKIGGGTVSLK